MTATVMLHPHKEAIRITQMLDRVLGADRFERGPVDVIGLALEYSKQTAPETPIHVIEERNLPGCMGALVYGDTKPRQWAIAYHQGQSDGRRAFTVGHEFGHYILHRDLIETDDAFSGGIWCNEESVLRRNGTGIEKEADTFAADLLMPLHDFRAQIPAQDQPNLERLGRCAKRYGVSLTAAILRWLEYTETRAMMLVSNEGFAHWAWSSEAAFKSGIFARTKQTVFELPTGAMAAKRDFPVEAATGISQAADVWGFREPCIEMCLRSNRYDQEITLLHFGRAAPVFQPQEVESDVYDRFLESGRSHLHR